VCLTRLPFLLQPLVSFYLSFFFSSLSSTFSSPAYATLHLFQFLLLVLLLILHLFILFLLLPPTRFELQFPLFSKYTSGKDSLNGASDYRKAITGQHRNTNTCSKWDLDSQPQDKTKHELYSKAIRTGKLLLHEPKLKLTGYNISVAPVPFILSPYSEYRNKVTCLYLSTRLAYPLPHYPRASSCESMSATRDILETPRNTSTWNRSAF
jgi:hypothetical protein